MPETLTSTTSFTISRVFDAPKEAVFNAWTDPKILQQWWGPPGFTVPSLTVDLRPGGKYRIGMKPPDDEVYYLVGAYVEIKPPDKLVYTWAWEEDTGPGHESLVSVEFKARAGKTEVVITHERLASEESRDKHVFGWTGCLDHLADMLRAKAG